MRKLNPKQARAVMQIADDHWSTGRDGYRDSGFIMFRRRLDDLTAKPGDKAFCEGCKWWEKCPSTAGYYWNCEYKGGCADGCPERRWEE